MGRAGYHYDIDQWELIRWRGAVQSAIRGRRGQAFLRELLQALDAIPERRLIAEEFQDEHGQVCAIGSLGLQRGIDLSALDPYDYQDLSNTFGVAQALVREIEAINDEECRHVSPEERFLRVRAWVLEQILDPESIPQEA